MTELYDRKNTFWDEYYSKVGKNDQSPFTKPLHIKLISEIPSDVETILDAGCGGGALMNRLNQEKSWSLTGLERSKDGVNYVNNILNLKAIEGDITNLPFKNNEFDLVVCSEVLEHLKKEDIPIAISELERVAKKYIMLSTPFKENISYAEVKCFNCNHMFHCAGHIRSIDETFFEKFITNSDSIKYFYTGKKEIRLMSFADYFWANGVNHYFINELKCPECLMEIKKSKLNFKLKLINYCYLSFQRITRFFGIGTSPNNIISLIKI